MIFIYSTFPSEKEAKETAKKLLKKKLAACCNIFPIDSLYVWSSSAKATEDKKGKIVKDREFAVIIKTRRENFGKVEKLILENHSYENPAIIEIPLGRITGKYLKWLDKNS